MELYFERFHVIMVYLQSIKNIGEKPSFLFIFLMGEKSYQIKDYVHDVAVAFAGVLNPKGRLAHNENEMYSSDRYKLESWNPEDTIPVATFCYEKYSPKYKKN